jgi:hypothetical protein
VNALAVVAASVAGAAAFAVAPDGWEVPGLALGHSAGFAAGAAVLASSFSKKEGRVRSTQLVGSTLRSFGGALAAGAVMAVAAWLLGSDGVGDSFVTLAVAGVAGAACYAGLMSWAKSREMQRLVLLVRGARA